MIELSGEEIAALAGAASVRAGRDGGPARAVIDNREVSGGELFIGLPGASHDGGRFASDAIAAGAWGAIVGTEWAERVEGEAWVFSTPDPLSALQQLARGRRRQLGAKVVGITGSTGKTSVKDICASILPGRVHTSAANFNTEVGLPLSILAAPPGSDVLVLEMGMRGIGQIAELCAIAEPEVGAITNIGPAHLELLGSVEAVAEAKAEILAGVGAGVGIVPADEPLLEPHLGDVPRLITFGAGGDVVAAYVERGEGRTRIEVESPAGEAVFDFRFEAPYHVSNALCAIACGVGLGHPPAEMTAGAGQIAFSGLRGEIVDLRGGIRLVNDTYNANPISVKAALDHLVEIAEEGRAVAVLGGMAELGEASDALHTEVATHARRIGVEPLIGVGELARAYQPDHWLAGTDAAVADLESLLSEGDVVLVKGSRSVGLDRLVDRLAEELSP